MAKKGGAQQIQVQIETAEELSSFISQNGLLVLDVYSRWCGPCIAMIGALRKAKTEGGGEYLQLATVQCDDIKVFHRFRNKSEPTWIFVSNEKVIDCLFGSNAIVLAETIKKELKLIEQQKDTITKDPREVFELHEYTLIEQEIHQRALDAKEANDRRLKDEAEAEYQRNIRFILGEIVDRLADMGVTVLLPHVMHNDLSKELEEVAQHFNLVPKSKVDAVMSPEHLHIINFECEGGSENVPRELWDYIVKKTIFMVCWKANDGELRPILEICGELIALFTTSATTTTITNNSEEEEVDLIEYNDLIIHRIKSLILTEDDLKGPLNRFSNMKIEVSSITSNICALLNEKSVINIKMNEYSDIIDSTSTTSQVRMTSNSSNRSSGGNIFHNSTGDNGKNDQRDISKSSGMKMEVLDITSNIWEVLNENQVINNKMNKNTEVFDAASTASWDPSNIASKNFSNSSDMRMEALDITSEICNNLNEHSVVGQTIDNNGVLHTSEGTTFDNMSKNGTLTSSDIKMEVLDVTSDIYNALSEVDSKNLIEVDGNISDISSSPSQAPIVSKESNSSSAIKPEPIHLPTNNSNIPIDDQWPNEVSALAAPTNSQPIKIPGIWLPPNRWANAAFIYLYFKSLAEHILPVDHGPEPPHVLMTFNANKHDDVLTIIKQQNLNILAYGYFLSDDRSTIKLIADTAKAYRHYLRSAQDAGIKLVLKVDNVTDDAIFALVTLGPSYISQNTVAGAAECVKYFPKEYTRGIDLKELEAEEEEEECDEEETEECAK